MKTHQTLKFHKIAFIKSHNPDPPLIFLPELNGRNSIMASTFSAIVCMFSNINKQKPNTTFIKLVPVCDASVCVGVCFHARLSMRTCFDVHTYISVISTMWKITCRKNRSRTNERTNTTQRNTQHVRTFGCNEFSNMYVVVEKRYFTPKFAYPSHPCPYTAAHCGPAASQSLAIHKSLATFLRARNSRSLRCGGGGSGDDSKGDGKRRHSCPSVVQTLAFVRAC